MEETVVTMVEAMLVVTTAMEAMGTMRVERAVDPEVADQAQAQLQRQLSAEQTLLKQRAF